MVSYLPDAHDSRGYGPLNFTLVVAMVYILGGINIIGLVSGKAVLAQDSRHAKVCMVGFAGMQPLMILFLAFAISGVL